MGSATAVPMLLVHGWAGSPRVWEPLRDSLRRHGHTGPVVAVALPGAPGAEAGPTTVPGAVAAAERALRGLGPALVVGHSMGAQVTIGLQRSVPELVLGEVALDPAYNNDDPVADLDHWAARIEAGDRAGLTAFFDGALGSVPAESARLVHADLAATDLADVARYLRSEYLDADAIGRVEATARAALLRRRPVLAIHAGDRGAAAERALPAPDGSAVETWGGFGHFLQLEDPDRVAASLLAFTDRLVGQSSSASVARAAATNGSA